MSTEAGYNPTIKELPSNERPRERLLHYGAGAVSTAELLAIILRTGVQDENVVRVAQRLLAAFGNLAGLAQANATELMSEKGLGPAKVAQAARLRCVRLARCGDDDICQFSLRTGHLA